MGSSKEGRDSKVSIEIGGCARGGCEWVGGEVAGGARGDFG